jgi:hypothetical protein
MLKCFNMFKCSAALVAILFALLTLATGTTAQTAPPNFPMALMCYFSENQTWLVGYLYRVKKDGDAIYLGAGGRLSARVNAKGVVVAPTNRLASSECSGKTLEELRSNGQAIDFQRTVKPISK